MFESIEKRRAAVRALILSAAVGAVLVVTACNTVAGVGKDLQEGSENVKDAIEN